MPTRRGSGKVAPCRPATPPAGTVKPSGSVPPPPGIRHYLNPVRRALRDRHPDLRAHPRLPRRNRDAAQDALLACLARLPSLDTETLRFGAYVQAAAVRARRSAGCAPSKRLAPVADLVANANLAADPAGQFEAAERRQTVRAAVRSLPDRQRLALFRDTYEDRTRQAIAAELDLDTNAVSQLLWRARRTLETRLSTAA